MRRLRTLSLAESSKETANAGAPGEVVGVALQRGTETVLL